jgi:hypothetical protein
MTLQVEEHLDHQRWLMNNGLLNDLHKDTLYLYGTLVHKDVQAIELNIDIENKNLDYTIYVHPKLFKSYELYSELCNTDSIIGLWRLKRLLKKKGNLNFMAILSGFVKDYCGPKWSVKLKIEDFSSYESGFKEIDSGPTDGSDANLSTNKK